MTSFLARPVWRIGAALAVVNAVVTAVDLFTTGFLLALPGGQFVEGEPVAAAGHAILGTYGYGLVVAVPLMVVQCLVLAHRPRSWVGWAASALVIASVAAHALIAGRNVHLVVEFLGAL